MIAPTLEECRRLAVTIGMPELEGEKFFYHHDARGWKLDGKPMVNFRSAMQTWRIKWQEGQQRFAARQAQPSAGMQLMIQKGEYDRIIARLQVLEATYGQHQSWDEDDKAERKRLIARREELKRILGITI